MSDSDLLDDESEEEILRVVPAKRGRGSRKIIEDSSNNNNSFDMSKLTKRQRMSLMQTGNAATTHEIGRHNRESLFAKGEEDNAFYALGHKKPKKREQMVTEDAEEV
jgi:hypothetical protein